MKELAASPIALTKRLIRRQPQPKKFFISTGCLRISPLLNCQPQYLSNSRSCWQWKEIRERMEISVLVFKNMLWMPETVLTYSMSYKVLSVSYKRPFHRTVHAIHPLPHFAYLKKFESSRLFQFDYWSAKFKLTSFASYGGTSSISSSI